VESYGLDWHSLCWEAANVGFQGPFPDGKHTKGDDEKEGRIHEELNKDLHTGIDAISRFLDSNWWSWKRGSALLFWRWPEGEQRKFARDGMPAWVRSCLPRFLGPP
jgi:hypothetical protein